MRLSGFVLGFAAASLVAVPAFAAAAPAGNPAARLSLASAKNVSRAGTRTKGRSNLAGTALVVAVVAGAAVATGAVVAATEDNSSSN
jgi:hypothetical protein